LKTPKRLKPLLEDGLIDEVLRPLMSGKEADVFIVRCGSEIRCAKIYKEADKRGFKQATQYQEGRKVRNSRRARAMEKSSRYGRREQEQAWQNTEVDALYRLARVDVRVPKPYGCFDGVLLMELICDDQGFEAPRLNDVAMSSTQAVEDHLLMMRYVVRMLCEGLVHGDLSEFNVLVDDYGPVIIDLPQVVDAAANNHAEHFFTRDVNKITSYYGLFSPEILNTRYAEEIWALYEAGELHPEVELSGDYSTVEVDADVDAVLEEIKQAMLEEEQRLARLAEAS
jgi:RIO kinase 1